jgi:hypothetical protein
MQLFRDEEHVEAWCRERDRERGGILTTAQLWGLARAWYADRLAPDWRRRTPAEAEEVFSSLGLVGSFWKLAG